MRVHPKSIKKMKNHLRELTVRGNKWSNPEREEKLRKYATGWINYYRYADMRSLMETTDEWLRHRIRAVYWKQWKRVRTRYKMLRALHLPEWKVHEMANCRKGTWRAAEMLNSVLTKKILVDRLGYPSMTAPLFESTCKLLNCVVPNGTLRGVEGEGQISPIRSIRPASDCRACTGRSLLRCGPCRTRATGTQHHLPGNGHRVG